MVCWKAGKPDSGRHARLEITLPRRVGYFHPQKCDGDTIKSQYGYQLPAGIFS